MTSPCKHPPAAFWITVALVVVLVGYPLSFGPACWLAGEWTTHNTLAITIIPKAYYPVLWLARLDRREIAPNTFNGGWLDGSVQWYATLGRR